MPIPLKCGCGKQLQVRDELAGKKARCPGCGTVMAVPSTAQKVSVPEGRSKSPSSVRRRQEEVDEESARITRKRPLADVRSSVANQDTDDSLDSSPLERDDGGTEERRRRRKKKKKSSVLFIPLITLFGIDLTPLKLIIVGAVFCIAGVGAFLYLSGSEAQVKVVDVYNLSEDLAEFTTGEVDFHDVVMNALFKKEIPTAFVVRPQSDGNFLMVKFKLSERTMKKLVGPDYLNFVMKKKDVVLQNDEEELHPIFLFEHEKNIKEYIIKPKKLLDDDEGKPERVDAGEVIEAHNKPISARPESPWNHEGLLHIDTSGKSTFKGIRGMKVTYDHGPLPSKEVKITWDPDSFFRFGVKQEEIASEIWLYDWRVTCLFPRPASTKHLKLTVIGKQMKMDYP